MTLVLASTSPRRRELLERLGLSFVVDAGSLVEREPCPGEDSAAYALELAIAKGAEVADRHPMDVVLSADTVVSVGGEILGKPGDAADAGRMLALLRGREHSVVTAVAVHHGGSVAHRVEAATVEMRAFDDDEVARYVATGEPHDKAGAYAVQGAGGALVRRVEGCFETVVGLPLCAVQELLRDQGLAVPRSRLCRHESSTFAGPQSTADTQHFESCAQPATPYHDSERNPPGRLSGS